MESILKTRSLQSKFSLCMGVGPSTTTDIYRFSPGPMVTGEEGIRTRQKVWGEIVDVLKKSDPELVLQDE